MPYGFSLPTFSFTVRQKALEQRVLSSVECCYSIRTKFLPKGTLLCVRAYVKYIVKRFENKQVGWYQYIISHGHQVLYKKVTGIIGQSFKFLLGVVV